MRTQVSTSVDLARHFGPSWLMYRAAYALRKRTGAIRRSLPATSWDAQPLASFLSDPTLADAERYARSQDERHHSFLWGESFGTRTAALLNQWTSPNDGAVATANKIYQGKFRLFETHEIHLGDSPNWHRDPFTNRQYPSDRHWTQLGDFDGGDIKLVWELSRFSWVYPLVRAYWRTTDERFPQRFWQLIASWCDANPPQSGVHWKCGQEIALRLLAACFGLFGFASSAQTTPQCRVMIAQLVAVSAQRIAANLKYALSQQNNHGIVEATGLWTTGLLFAELKDAGDWANLGRKALESQIRDLIDDDGAFSQHSVNYQRVMLHACLWAIRLGSVHGQPLSDEFIQRVSRAGEFLQALMDENSGRLPRYGQNDGALVLPLSECTPDDYRPVIQATARITTGGACLPPGPWEEESLWLCGADTFPQEPVENRNSGDWFAASGGYQVLRSKSGKVFTRAGRFRHRPSHADLLHADVWWRGVNVALDPGTYTYNEPPPWDNPLAGSRYHNCVTVDGHDQMRRASRFLWLPWIRGQRTIYETSPTGLVTCWEGTHNGYQRLPAAVTYQRAILRLGAENWVVVDRLHSTSPHAYRLHWLLVDAPFQINCERQRVELCTDAGAYAVQCGVLHASTAEPQAVQDNFDVLRADPLSPRGWQAPHYRDRQPAVSVELVTQTAAAGFWTVLGPATTAVNYTSILKLVTPEGHWCIDLSCPSLPERPVVNSVRLNGPISDALVLEPDSRIEMSSQGAY